MVNGYFSLQVFLFHHRLPSQSINFRQTSREKFGCFKFCKYASIKTPGKINCWWKYFAQFEKTKFFNIWLRNWRCNMWIYILHFCHWIIMIMLMGNSLQNLTYRIYLINSRAYYSKTSKKNQGARVYLDACIIKWRLLRIPPKCTYYLMANFQRQ